MKLTASDLVRAIGSLPRSRRYHYIHKANKNTIQIKDVAEPEGPIRIKRFIFSENRLVNQTISTQMLWRVANAFKEGHPINLDRVLGGSYNTRSALEALLAHTPEFYFGYPGRIESTSSTAKIKKGHKHIIWLPDQPHENGILKEIQTNIVISEVPTVETIYDSLTLPVDQPAAELDIDVQRRHAQIQIALIMIGSQLGFKVWIPPNDKGISYQGKPIGTMDPVIRDLDEQPLIKSFSKAVEAARYIDCIWFKNHKLMPAVIEIEHSTGVTSGLTRMKNFFDEIPPFPTRWVIVGPDDDRGKVLKEANKEQFKDLNALFFPYSNVEELYSLCQRRKIKGVQEEFLDCFMESCISI